MRLRRSDLAAIVFRKVVQISVLVFVAWAAMTGIWRNYKMAHNSSRLVGLMEGELWAGLYAKNESLLGLRGEPYRASFDFLGMPWAATLFGIETADPIMVLANLVATGTLALGLIPAVLLAVGLAAIFGKVFCSHLCPMRLLFEFGQLIRGGLLWLKIPLPHMRLDVRVGGWILLGGLFATVFIGTGVWFLLLPYLDVVSAIVLTITAGTTAGLGSIILGWWLADVLFAPGAFCHNLCPQGFLLEHLGRFSLLKLRKRRESACPSNCRACSLACPYGLNPGEETHMPACNNCGQCVPVCPDRKLSRKFRLPVVAALLTVMLLPLDVGAHHNKGLPHYGYYENYPQVPTQENIIVDGRWEMGATVFNFQGLERRDANAPNDVKFFVYLYDLESDENYVGPVTFEIVHDGEVVSRFERDGVDEELVYSTRETLPESGDYELVAYVPGSDPVSLAFYLDLNTEDISWGFLLGLAGPLVPLFGLALLGRSRRGRARRMQVQAATGGAR